MCLVFDTLVEHFLCRTHSKQAIDQNLTGEKGKETKNHVNTTLYLSEIKTDYEKPTLAAIAAIPQKKKAS